MALHHDLRYALRTMARTPVSTAVAVLSLALGIGATTTVFTLINGLMFRPLPVRDPGSLVELLTRYPGEPRMNVFGFALSAVVMVVVAIVAAYVPARRAARVEPLQVLRHE